MTNGHYICAVRRKIHREDILEAGLQLMFLNGYHATGIKEITTQVSIPKGSFYNHFPSKEAFALEVVKMYCDNGIEMYKSIFLDKNTRPIQRIEHFFNRLIKQYSHELNFKLGCIMGNFSIELSDVNEQFRILLDDEFNKCETIIATCLQEAVEQGEVSKSSTPQQLAAFILNSWHGAMLRMKSTGNSKPLVDCKEMVMNLLKL